MKVREVLTEATWLQHTYASDRVGDRINPRSEAAACWCLVGAISKCYLPSLEVMSVVAEFGRTETVDFAQYDRVIEKVLEKLAITETDIRMGQAIANIVQWNDHPLRTFDEVKALVDALDI